MEEWSKVVTHPLGLAGFALFLIFGLVARLKRRDERRWVFPVSLVMAVVALVGGLGLAYRQTKNNATSVIQINTGGVNLNGASNSTINIDQSTDKSVSEQGTGSQDASHSDPQKSPAQKSSPQKAPKNER